MVKSTRFIGYIGIVLLIAGLAGWALQLTGGLLAGSGMTNIFLWGLMIAMFAFMVGFGAGAQMVAGAIYLCRKEGLYPLARTAAAVGLACVAAAGVAILADLGAIRNILAMIVGLNLRSPLAWDMIALSVFIVVSIVQLVVMARGGSSTRLWVILASLCAVALQVVEGLLFSTQSAHAWWATPIMPIDFLVVAFVSGSALMLLIACVKGAEVPAVAWLGRLCAWAIAVHLVLALCDLGLVALENSAVSGGVLAAIGAQLPLYLCELLLPAAAMVILFAWGRRGCRGSHDASEGCDRRPTAAFWAAILAIAGIFCHRLMLLYPAYNAPSLYLQLGGATTGPYPVSTGRYLDWDQAFALTTAYVPAFPEWLAALLPIGVAIVGTFVLLWIMKKLAPAGEA